MDTARNIADLVTAIDTLDADKVRLTEMAAEPVEFLCMLSAEISLHDQTTTIDVVRFLGNGHSVNQRIVHAMIEAAIRQITTIRAELTTELANL